MLGCPPDAVVASLSDIERRLAHTPTALRKQSKKTVANTRSRLKAAFLHLAGADSRPARGTPLAPPWKALYDQLADRRMRLGLSRLIRYASHRGLDPTEVDDAFVKELMSAASLERRTQGHARLAQHCRDLERSGGNGTGMADGSANAARPPQRERHLALTELPASFNRRSRRVPALGVRCRPVCRVGAEDTA